MVQIIFSVICEFIKWMLMFPSSFLLRNRNFYQQGTYDCIFFPYWKRKKHFTDEIVLLRIVKVFECVSSSLCSLLTLQSIWIDPLPFFFNCHCKAHCCHTNPFPPSMYLKNMFFIMFFLFKTEYFLAFRLLHFACLLHYVHLHCRIIFT